MQKQIFSSSLLILIFIETLLRLFTSNFDLSLMFGNKQTNINLKYKVSEVLNGII